MSFYGDNDNAIRLKISSMIALMSINIDRKLSSDMVGLH